MLLNKVYAEAYACPCVRLHPFDSIFFTQSNGNYVAIFTSTPPYRLNKYKRYMSQSSAISAWMGKNLLLALQMVLSSFMIISHPKL